MTVRKPKCVISTLSLPRYRFHVVASSLSLPCCRFLVIASTLSLPRCRFHVVASTESLFYRGVTFKFLTKILVAALLFYNVCFPSYHFHVVASTLWLSRCRYRDLPGFQPRNRTQHGGHVL